MVIPEGERSFISKRDWSLHRKGPQDETRHNEKVKQGIKGNLGKIVSDGSIITADPKSKKIIKVSMKSLEIPHIRHKQGDDGVATGDGSEQIGDIIGIEPVESGQGSGAGDQPGVEYYEAEIDLEELKNMIYEEFGLPYLRPKAKQQIESDIYVFDEVRRKRSPSNLDVYRTIFENMRRNAEQSGKPEIRDIKPEDFRVRTWRKEVREENSAVWIAMMDRSGSMGEFEKFISRTMNSYSVDFLRTEYPKVEVVFIVHDTEAYEVDEVQFFKRGESGGTKCSSANKLALEIIHRRYPAALYNIYLAHFSDGDNWAGGDNELCADLINKMIVEEDISQYAYIQISQTRDSGLMTVYKNQIKDPRFIGEPVNSTEDVWPCLKKIFNPNKQAA